MQKTEYRSQETEGKAEFRNQNSESRMKRRRVFDSWMIVQSGQRLAFLDPDRVK
jgi:hypothetical protein